MSSYSNWFLRNAQSLHQVLVEGHHHARTLTPRNLHAGVTHKHSAGLLRGQPTKCPCCGCSDNKWPQQANHNYRHGSLGGLTLQLHVFTLIKTSEKIYSTSSLTGIRQSDWGGASCYLAVASETVLIGSHSRASDITVLTILI